MSAATSNDAPKPPNELRTNVLATVSLVASFMIPALGIVTGHISLHQIAKTGESGRKIAVAGLVLGYVFLTVQITFLIVWSIFFIGALNAQQSTLIHA